MKKLLLMLLMFFLFLQGCAQAENNSGHLNYVETKLIDDDFVRDFPLEKVDFNIMEKWVENNAGYNIYFKEENGEHINLMYDSDYQTVIVLWPDPEDEDVYNLYKDNTTVGLWLITCSNDEADNVYSELTKELSTLCGNPERGISPADWSYLRYDYNGKKLDLYFRDDSEETEYLIYIYYPE